MKEATGDGKINWSLWAQWFDYVCRYEADVLGTAGEMATLETWYMKTSDDESCSEMVSNAMFHAGWGKNKPIQEHRSWLLEE